jgi:hypothetical protein
MLRSDSNSSCDYRQGSFAAAGNASNMEGCQQEDSLDFLHQALPFNLSELDDDLLAPPLAVQDSKNDTSFLYLAAPFELAGLDDDLLAAPDSSTDKDAWLHQAAPFNLQEMNDDLLGCMI